MKTFRERGNGSTRFGAQDDLDDWERKFKIENGRLVCVNDTKHTNSLYGFVSPPTVHSSSQRPSHAAAKPRSRPAERKTIVIQNTDLIQPIRDLQSPPPVPMRPPTSQAQPQHPPTRPATRPPTSYTLASQLRDDPDPEFQVVDVQFHNEFLTGIEDNGLLSLDVVESQAPSTIYQNEIQLKNLRERADRAVAQAIPSQESKTQKKWMEEEEAFAMGELISWLSRDLDFDVTIGIPCEDSNGHAN